MNVTGERAESVPGLVSEASTGGPPTNSPPTNVQDGGVKDWAGCDGFDSSLYVEWSGNLADRFFEELESARARAESDSSGSGSSFLWFGRTVLVAGHSIKKKGGGTYRYKVECDGCVLLIARARSPKGDWPNVLIEVGAMACLACGGSHAAAWDRVKALVSALGGKLERNKLGRMDLMNDLVGVSVQQFVDLWNGGAFVARAKRFQIHSGADGMVPGGSPDDFSVQLNGSHQRVMTLSIGKRIRFRVYDKLQELKDRPDEAKRAMLVEKWGGEPEAVTRCEFQLRREALVALGVDSMEDFMAREAEIVRWLTESWLCIRQPGMDRNHRKRSPVHELWERFAAGLGSMFWAEVKGVVLSPLVKRSTARGLVKQAAGCLSSWAARTFGGCEPGDVVAVMEEFLAECINEAGINETARRVQLKAEKWRVALAEGLVTLSPFKDPPCPWVGVDGATPARVY